MQPLNKQELLTIVGGFDLSGAVLNAILKGVSSIYEIGRNFGSSLRRIQSGTLCPV